jgi:hypothetical protein
MRTAGSATDAATDVGVAAGVSITRTISSSISDGKTSNQPTATTELSVEARASPRRWGARGLFPLTPAATEPPTPPRAAHGRYGRRPSR